MKKLQKDDKKTVSSREEGLYEGINGNTDVTIICIIIRNKKEVTTFAIQSSICGPLFIGQPMAQRKCCQAYLPDGRTNEN